MRLARRLALLLALLLQIAPLPARAQEAAPDSPVRLIPVEGVAFDIVLAPDGKSIAVVEQAAAHVTGEESDDYTLAPVRLYDLATGELLRTFTGEADFADSVAFTPDGKRLIALYRNGRLVMWDVATGRVGARVALPHFLTKVRVAPGGRSLVTLAGSPPPTLLIHDLRTGAIGKVLRTDFASAQAATDALSDVNSRLNLTVCGMAVGPGSRPNAFRIATATASGEIGLWDSRSGAYTLLRPPADQPGRFSACAPAFTPDGAMLYALDRDDTLVHFWDAATGEELEPIPTYGAARGVALSPAGGTFVALEDHTLYVNGVDYAVLESPGGAGYSPGMLSMLAFRLLITPDGRTAVMNPWFAADAENAVAVVTLP